MSSTTKLYQICQIIFPELAQVTYPEDMNDFHSFIDWLNTQHSNIQYVELKEYYDNGIDECYQLKQAHVDIEQLNQQIESEMNQLFEQFNEDDEWEEDPYKQTEDILFGNIEKVAQQHSLALLMISNENPYWMLVPDQTEQINRLIAAFNQTFTEVELYHYV